MMKEGNALTCSVVKQPRVRLEQKSRHVTHIHRQIFGLIGKDNLAVTLATISMFKR